MKIINKTENFYIVKLKKEEKNKIIIKDKINFKYIERFDPANFYITQEFPNNPYGYYRKRFVPSFIFQLFDVSFYCVAQHGLTNWSSSKIKQEIFLDVEEIYNFTFEELINYCYINEKTVTMTFKQFFYKIYKNQKIHTYNTYELLKKNGVIQGLIDQGLLDHPRFKNYYYRKIESIKNEKSILPQYQIKKINNQFYDDLYLNNNNNFLEKISNLL